MSDAGALPRHELDAFRPTLLRIARLHLRNDAWAEDAVGETMLAALENRAGFEGRSKVRTWLVGILKHKIIDCLRQRRREAPLDDEREQDGDLEDAIFQADGHYREQPADWSSPETMVSRIQFFDVLDACIQQLPPTQARVFMMREWLELSTDQICKELAISATNAGVLLHRARMRLRECLELRWFREPHPSGSR